MSKPLRIVLIEDEAATARNLDYILRSIDPEIQIMQTLQSVASAVEWLNENSNAYDLIFSDIRLTDGLCFEIFKKKNAGKPVIFVTAYNNYAVEAFRNNGIDYILKPFDEEEIRRALIKYRACTPADEIFEQSKIEALLQQLQSNSKTFKKSFLIHYRGRLIPIETSKINWFYTANEMVCIHTAEGQRYTINTTLEQLEGQLDPELFFRANRQFILNRQAVETVEYFFNGRLVVKVYPVSDVQILVSKARAMSFKKWLDQ